MKTKQRDRTENDKRHDDDSSQQDTNDSDEQHSDRGSDTNDSELTRAKKSQTAQSPPPTIVEWSARVVSLGLLVALVGYLVVTGLNASDPAQLVGEVERDRIEQRNGSWAVPAKVTNDGDVSLANTMVTLEVVSSEGEVIDSAEVVLVLLGQGGTHDVEFWFAEDPRDHRLRFDFGGSVVP